MRSIGPTLVSKNESVTVDCFYFLSFTPRLFSHLKLWHPLLFNVWSLSPVSRIFSSYRGPRYQWWTEVRGSGLRSLTSDLTKFSPCHFKFPSSRLLLKRFVILMLCLLACSLFYRKLKYLKPCNDWRKYCDYFEAKLY